MIYVIIIISISVVCYISELLYSVSTLHTTRGIKHTARCLPSTALCYCPAGEIHADLVFSNTACSCCCSCCCSCGCSCGGCCSCSCSCSCRSCSCCSSSC